MRSFSKMKSANNALLVVLAVMTLGLWGCAQGTSPTSSARLRDLEARHAKLDEDYRAAATARDQARKRASVLEQERAGLRHLVDQLTRERDELRQQLASRSSERDTLQGHLVQLGKELHNLAGRIDAAAGTQTSQPVTAEAAPAPEKSS
jgi:chromosome segregation ATPase